MDNIILQDKKTGELYRMVVEGEQIVLIGVSDGAETETFLDDKITGIRYSLLLEDGVLSLLEV